MMVLGLLVPAMAHSTEPLFDVDVTLKNTFDKGFKDLPILLRVCRVFGRGIDNDADPSLMDSRGRKARDYAQSGAKGAKRVVRLLGGSAASVQVAEIANLKTTVDGENVKIEYDLIASAPSCIKVKGSRDGGKNYNLRINHLTGDHGDDVDPGNGKTVYWSALDDYPKGLAGSNVVIEVVAQASCP